MTQAGSSMECPLAALGRDTPAVKTPQYRHPLSSSPLDPNVYKMGKRSPIYNTERSTENFEYQKSPYQQSFDQHPHRSSPFATGETTHHPMELYKNRSSYSYNMNKHMSSLYLDDMMPSNRSSSSSTPILDLIRNSSLETDGFNNSLQDPTPTNRYTSSQSETSESDRFFIDYHSGDSPLHGNKRNYHHFNRLKNRGTKLTAQQLRMGDNDQGYHTLMSSSVITTHINPSYGNWSRTETITCGLRLEALNTSVLLQIFQWLDQSDLCNLALTCKRFSLVAWSPYLWKTIHIKEQNVDRSLRMILRKLSSQNRVGICTEVDVISIENGMNLSDKGLNVITATCSNLKNFKSHNSHQITSTAVHHLLWNCPLLQHLDLTGANHVQSLLLTLGNDIKINLKLQYLDVTDCSAITDSAIELIVQACPQLTYLYLRRCVNISDAGIKFIPTYSSTLRELSVSDCINITDFGLYELAKLGPCLRYLSVAKCDRVSDAGLKIIARKCYKLRYLNTRGCEAVSDDSIIALARCCSRLRALDIGKCDVSDAGLRALAECCPNLKKIGLRNCDMITDRGVQFIAYYCRGLQQLNIQDCQISIEGYRAVKKYCKRCVIEHTNPGFC